MNDFKHKEHVTQTPDVSYIKNVNVTHETSDVQVPSIARFVIALLVLTIVIHVALWGMFRALERKEAQKDIQRSPMALSDKERLPPEPRLQGGSARQEHDSPTVGEPAVPSAAGRIRYSRPDDSRRSQTESLRFTETGTVGCVGQFAGERAGRQRERA